MTRLEELTPCGTQTYSKHPSRYAPGCPEKLLYGFGCTVRGSDGRDYIDFVSALGAVILGHADPEVNSEVSDQLRCGTSFSLATDIEEEVAELVCATVPGAEMVRFQKNGADACDAAVRLARHVTGRERVVTIGYHGKSDWTMADTNPHGIPAFNRDLLTRVPYGDIAALDVALNGPLFADLPPAGQTAHDTPAACLIMEPVVATHPVLPPPGYLQACRDLCTKHGALLIFDEVVTGFRMALGGAQEHYGIHADLVASGKAMANGMPISIVTGPRDLMQRLGGEVFCSTTFGGETLSLAAARATITKLRDLDVPARLDGLGTTIMAYYEAEALAHGLQDVTRIIGYPQRPVVVWDDAERGKRFAAEMLAHGFLWQGYFNLTLAHTQRDGLVPTLCVAFEAGMKAVRG
jgi:glutamate-1-semialdehyde aminotransferase